MNFYVCQIFSVRDYWFVFGTLRKNVFTYGKLRAQIGVEKAGKLAFLLKKT